MNQGKNYTKMRDPNLEIVKGPKLVGWRFGVFVGSIVGLIGLACYPIIIYPMMNPEEYKEIQKKTRAGIKQEDIQPGNMRVWSDPFGRKKE
ncbi:small integral membrane protein 20 [Culicoides brevitarsis]|uniref:small integral membrane protein 20 n=1 Tax=Culicoides brevitarsis TaxID=469753 RepID=UPI00307B6412